MSDPTARALHELAEARAAMLAEASTTHKAILDGTIPPPTVPTGGDEEMIGRLLSNVHRDERAQIVEPGHHQ